MHQYQDGDVIVTAKPDGRVGICICLPGTPRIAAQADISAQGWEVIRDLEPREEEPETKPGEPDPEDPDPWRAKTGPSRADSERE